MSTVIAFRPARESARRAIQARPTLSGPKIVILPVVRIERHADATQTETNLAGARAPRGAEPGMRH